MGFKTFEEIDAWQEARKLSTQVNTYCKKAVDCHDYAWVDQISRATMSTMANIAEGNDAKTNAEFIVFLGYAKRSNAEVQSHLYCGLDRGYFQEDDFKKSYDLSKKIGAQIARLMTYLQAHPSNFRLAKNVTSSQRAND